jgi:hypothetical protein
MRIRTVKPEFWTSEDVAKHDWDIRLVFIGLWSYVDDNGVGRDNEKLIAADLFPLEEDPRATLDAVSRALAHLAKGGQITRYDVDGKRYLAVANWHHQKIDRPSKPRYPQPPARGVVALTSDDAEEPEILDEPSRDSRDSLDAVPGDQGIRVEELFPTPSGVGTSKRKTLDDHFAEFWDHYPLKKGKGAARTAWDKARARKPIPELLAAVDVFAADPNLPRDRSKLPYPQKWLNEQRWNDEPYSPAGEPTGAAAAVHADGSIDVDAVLGKDRWQPPTPPDDTQPGSPGYAAWARGQWTTRHAERLEEAKAVLARRSQST